MTRVPCADCLSLSIAGGSSPCVEQSAVLVNMNDDDDDDDDENTLENGRRHLHLLSKQIRDQKTSDHSVGSGNRQNLQAERKLLDRKPRGDRLRNRKGSPLGLTLEVMEGIM